MKAYTIGKDARKHWDWLEPYVARSIARNVDGFTTDDILQDVLAMRSLFLVIEDDDGVMVVSVLDILPDAVHVHTMTGRRMKTWIKLADEVIGGIAKALGKRNITTVARKGWLPNLKALGWSEHSVLIARKVK